MLVMVAASLVIGTSLTFPIVIRQGLVDNLVSPAEANMYFIIYLVLGISG
jgi:hypothetical protein